MVSCPDAVRITRQGRPRALRVLEGVTRLALAIFSTGLWGNPHLAGNRKSSWDQSIDRESSPAAQAPRLSGAPWSAPPTRDLPSAIRGLLFIQHMRYKSGYNLFHLLLMTVPEKEFKPFLFIATKLFKRNKCITLNSVA